MSFRFLEHTADVQVECCAASFHGLLEAAAHALYALALREMRAEVHSTRSIEVKGESREDILVRWLQELIFMLEVERFVATEFAFAADDPLAFVAELRGYTCAPKERVQEVKGATYHEIELRETGEGFTARVIFDL